MKLYLVKPDSEKPKNCVPKRTFFHKSDLIDAVNKLMGISDVVRDRIIAALHAMSNDELMSPIVTDLAFVKASIRLPRSAGILRVANEVYDTVRLRDANGNFTD
ncbi:MAG: hypothetical protein UT33_C0005G0083 [Candidatus Peregrinibacteria bacterium GW2011_GWC2_39_14]|nr:MAG: hypothetical protein US92_C0001G0083 [Candidatus Peregrinibacteria bacterium GW2011_GWA2_38_36]KKR07139.1 MAG: hypothetical protein UT33_C0005G0083 [Candidatus Peregrinibacteria bacterium GW2011_GWC2_39_14]